jgi:hypothetical protein
MNMHKPVLLLISALLLTPAAAAKDDDGRVERSGDCSGSSNWTLKAKPDDGRLEVEFEVDQNKNGVRWHVVLKRNGNKVREANRVTQGPSGSFSYEKRIADPAGTDKIVGVATRESGERCRGSVRV